MNELYWCSSPIIIIIIIAYNYHYTSSLQGVIFYQKGDSLSAIPYIEKALLSNNSHEGFHNSLGQYLLWRWWWSLLQWWWIFYFDGHYKEDDHDDDGDDDNDDNDDNDDDE